MDPEFQDNTLGARVIQGLYGRVPGSQYLVIPSAKPSSSATLLAVRRLRAEVAAVFSNGHSDALIDQNTGNKRLLRFRHRPEYINLYNSFQSLVNLPISELPKWSHICLLRKERLVLIWGYDTDHLKCILSESRTILSEWVC